MKTLLARFTLISMIFTLFFTVFAASAQDENPLKGTGWLLVSYGETDVIADSTVTLEFGIDGSINGSGGCNSYFGTYIIEGERISFIELGSTVMACSDTSDQEGAYLDALRSATTYTLSDNQLILTYSDGQELIFESIDTMLKNTRWELTSFGDETAVLPDSTITLEFFTITRLSSNSGCNPFLAEYRSDGENIEFRDISRTRMACMEDGLMEQENAYLEALESATTYSVTEDELILNYDGGQLIFRAVREIVDTRWALVSYGEIDDPTVVLPESAITLEFDAENNAFGSGGCNEYNGLYRLEDDSIIFEDIISTLRACVDNAITEQEQVYLEALNTATSYEISETQLRINYGENEQLVFDEVSPLVDTQWQFIAFSITRFEGTPAIPDSEVTLEFNANNEVSGSAGCNSYGGSYTSDEETISFGPLFRTEMACMEDGLMEQENAYLEALESATAYEFFEGQLTITYGNNQHLIFSEIIPADS